MILRSATILAVAVVAFVGCGKKEEETPTPPPVAETPAAETPQDASAAAPAEEKAAPVAQKNWDEYVTKIVRLRSGPMTDEKREEMLGLQDELVAAAASDPKAREAYQNLSRIMTGR